MFSHKKKVLALAGAIANLSFSVCVAGVATFAWFCENDMVYSNGMKIQSNGPDIVVNNYTILKYDDDLKKGVAYYNNADEFFLPDYDEYIKARNVYSNIVIRADLGFGRGLDSSIEAVEIDITKLASSTLKDANGIRQLTSNVAQFKCITTSYTPFNSSTEIPIGVGISEVKGDYKDVDDAMYRTAIAYFATRKTPSTFISLMNGQPVDPDNGNTITIVPELYNVGTVGRAIVYIECSYNEQLASGFVADHPDEPIHNLVGDIDSISFTIRPFNAGEYGQRNTGKYLQMTDVGRSYDGKYLASYTGNDSESVLDGSKATGSETIGSSSGINTNNNNYAVGNYMANNKSSVYASDRIDDASLTYSKRAGTYQSEGGYYVGNNTSTAGIISNASSEGLTNSLEFNSDNAIVKSTVNTNMQLKYDTANEKYAYYNNTNSDISLYRFHENDMIDATLSSLSVQGPTGQAAQYSVGEYFSLRGVTCTATYTRGNSSFTINVSSVCTYTSSPEGTLEPDKSIFSVSNPNKTINVTYYDRGVTKTGSFTLSIIEDVIEYIEITSPATHTTYIKGDTFDITGLQVTGTFTVNGQVDVTSQCIFKINDVTYTPGATLNISGDNIYVYVIYGGNATLGTSYQDRRYTISIKEYVCQIDEENENILLNESIGLSLTFNSTVVWEITGTAGAVSFSSSEVVTTYTTTYTGSNWANQTETVTVYGLAGGQCTVTAKIQGRDSVRDTCIVRVLDGSSLYATYVVTSKSAVNTTGLPPQYSTATYANTAGGNIDQITANNTATLTLTGYAGYKITGITLSMKSNASKGGGSFTAVIGGSSTIASITDSKFNTDNWYGAWSGTNYVDITPTISLQKVIRSGENVVLTITGSENSIYCQSYTIYYEEAVTVDATALNVYKPNGDEIANGATVTLNGGSIGDSWIPTATVTYSDTSSNHDVTWSKTGNGITINAQNGSIVIGSTSGSATITVTTNTNASNDQPIVKSFTLTWENYTRVLDTISVTPTEGTTTFELNDTFSFTGTVTANYNDNSHADVTASATFSGYDMSQSGTQTVTVSYTENGVTKTTTYTITVGGGTPVETYDFTWNLATASYDANPTTELVTWSHTAATMSAIRASSSTTAVNNYLGGTNSSTRFYKNNTLSITPSSGYTITSIEYTANTDGYATAFQSSTWTNGTAVKNGTKVTVTPADGTATISAVIGGTTGGTSVKVYYTTGSTPPTPKVLESISLSGTYQTEFTVGDTFNHTGVVVTATYDDESTANVTSSAVFSSPDMSTAGSKTVYVSYTENEVEKTTSYTITVSAPPVLESITLSGTYQTEFTVGNTFNHNGLVVTAHYDDESTANVTASATFSEPDMSSQGTKTITVTYIEGGVTATATYDITVSPSGGTHTEIYYEKVTSVDDLVSGGTYLIVCEDQSVALDGSLETLDAVEDTISISPSGGEIASSLTTEASYFTITFSNDSYLIQSASGKYIGHTGTKNTLNQSDSASLTNTITFDGSGNANINGGGSYNLRYNKASDQKRFRYFTSAQTSIQLYIRKSRTVND